MLRSTHGMHTVHARYHRNRGQQETRKRWQDWSKRSRLVQSGKVGRKTIAKWNTRVKERKAQGRGPWLHTVDVPNEALTELLEFMTTRCFVRNHQHSAVRGYLATINFFYKMSAGSKLPLSHCMTTAVGKGDRQGARYVYQEQTS